MRGTLKRNQRNKLRKELQNRIRSGDYCLEQTSGVSGRNSSKQTSRKTKKQDKKISRQSDEKTLRQGTSQNRNNDKQSLQEQTRTLPKKQNRFLYPKAKLIGALLIGGGLILAALSFADSNPGVIQLGSADLLDALSISHKERSTDGVVSLDSDVSWQGHFSNDLPDGFDEEIGLGSESVAVSNDGRTVGYTSNKSLEETMAEIRKGLEEKGWNYVPSGQNFAATFAKDSGAFCWLAVTCASIGEETSVVLVFEKAPDEKVPKG